jgi:hypothetical protein
MCAHIALATCAAVSSNAAFWKGTTRRRLNTQRGEKERKKPRLQTPTHTKRKEKEDDINNTIQRSIPGRRIEQEQKK